MADLLAVKRLSASDLTFFEPMFRVLGAGNQKSINLNADVLTGQLYPSLSAVAATQPDGEIGLPLTIYGPYDQPPHRVRRKILKGDGYKNWRLNGEFVYDPPGQEGRYGALAAGDIAVFAFTGTISPVAITLIIVSQNNVNERSVYVPLSQMVSAGRRSMAVLGQDILNGIVAEAHLNEHHPLNLLVYDDQDELDLENLVSGGSSVFARTTRGARRGIISPERFTAAQIKAQETGRVGEALVDAFLSRTHAARGGGSHDWVSQINAVAPYDFLVHGNLFVGTIDHVIDVKSTVGPFEAGFHISMAELLWAEQSNIPYLIFRVSELSDEGATLNCSPDIRQFAATVLSAFRMLGLPGVRPDGFTIDPKSMGVVWSESHLLPPLDPEE